MALHLSANGTSRRPASDLDARLRAEADLQEAKALLRRLLAAEDRLGLVFPVMDDTRRFLAAQRHRGD